MHELSAVKNTWKVITAKGEVHVLNKHCVVFHVSNKSLSDKDKASRCSSLSAIQTKTAMT